MVHISDHDLERYHLSMVSDEAEAPFEEHLLACPACAERATFVYAMRAGIEGGYCVMRGFKRSVHPNESRFRPPSEARSVTDRKVRT